MFREELSAARTVSWMDLAVTFDEIWKVLEVPGE